MKDRRETFRHGTVRKLDHVKVNQQDYGGRRHQSTSCAALEPMLSYRQIFGSPRSGTFRGRRVRVASADDQLDNLDTVATLNKGQKESG